MIPPLAVTLGDPGGIGPEITAKAWAAMRGAGNIFALIGTIDAARRACRAQDLPDPQAIGSFAQAADIFPHALPVLPLSGPDIEPGRPDSAAAGLIIGSIAKAVELTLSGEAAAVVTNPIAKSVLYAAGFAHPGHTEYLGELTRNIAMEGERGPVMMLTAAGLRVALVTIHTPISKVAAALTGGLIKSRARVLHQSLKRDFGIKHPRIAVCGLNPHAGEKGGIGREEIEIINPACEALRAEGINLTNALPADTLFHADARAGYDAALAMYHDQGLIPVKTLDFHGGVNVTLGLPIVRTSPDHGTAFDIAGKGIARPDSLLAALKIARTMSDHRRGA
ncbi:4-hydroxythreonine-4-phosphate dehydrogenase PdxA [Robiginitomaculum antarcticum]|uniref:4-hydroxythreonine-4-phosphate dehydrogenase PdxA n=1 Tax=Robiginitomaculum antarcticum TaxID=437507 RepID=UPI000377A5F9|nr:4-hydroxythreonine-4-phosphate dehydrogenase PdxA [Robiginitomaculum antarcticum]